MLCIRRKDNSANTSPAIHAFVFFAQIQNFKTHSPVHIALEYNHLSQAENKSQYYKTCRKSENAFLRRVTGRSTRLRLR